MCDKGAAYPPQSTQSWSRALPVAALTRWCSARCGSCGSSSARDRQAVDQPPLPCCTAVTDSSLTFPLQAVEPNGMFSRVFWFGGITASEIALTGLHVPAGRCPGSAIRSIALATPLGGSVTGLRGAAGSWVDGWPIVVSGVPPACATPG